MKNTGVLKAKKELIYSDSGRSGLNDPSAFSVSPPLSGIDFVDQGRSEAQSPQTLTIQKKSISSPAESGGGLTLNTPGDCHEREADHVADQIAQGSSSKVTVRKIGTPRIQQKSASSSNRSFAASRVSSSFEKKVQESSKGGQPLSNAVRGPMEQSFGADLGGVRVHTDAAADGMNSSLKSHAFTTGQHIFFKQGKYAPKEASGKKLLAHELTHTQQQGASDRIAPWWPLGHRTLTTKVFNDDDDLNTSYDEAAIAYLIKRSPDIDFIQDETNAMEKGIADAKPIIDKFKADLESGKKSRVDAAKKVWDENKLHYRPKWYMPHHGEAGYYTDEAGPAKAKNKAMTDHLVNTASVLYNAGKREAGLSILSDAVHQAEDRGSHCEGEKFKGHDSRQAIPAKYLGMFKPADDQKPDQSEMWRQLHPQGKVPDPDNANKNRTGARVGMKFAQQALLSFRAKVVDDEEIITLRNPNIEDEPSPSQRHSKINTGKAGRVTALSDNIKTKFAGTTGVDTINSVEKWKKVSTNVQDIDDQGQEDVDLSHVNYIKIWISSELMERIRLKDATASKTNSLSKDISIAEDELKDMKKDKNYKALFDLLPDQHNDDEWFAKHAAKNYRYQRATRFAGNKDQDVIE